MAIGNNILNIFKGIRLPSLLVSILYLIFALFFFCSLLISSFILMLQYVLKNLEILYLSCLYFCLFYLHCFSVLHVWVCCSVFGFCCLWSAYEYTFGVVVFITITAGYSTCPGLSQMVWTSAVFVFSLIRLLGYMLFLLLFCICLGLWLDFLIISKSFVSFRLSSMAFSEYCTSILLAQDKIVHL